MKVLFEDEENAVEVEREFETRDLLAAVDVFDEMRTYPRTTPQLHEATPLPPRRQTALTRLSFEGRR